MVIYHACCESVSVTIPLENESRIRFTDQRILVRFNGMLLIGTAACSLQYPMEIWPYINCLGRFTVSILHIYMNRVIRKTSNQRCPKTAALMWAIQKISKARPTY